MLTKQKSVDMCTCVYTYACLLSHASTLTGAKCIGSQAHNHIAHIHVHSLVIYTTMNSCTCTHACAHTYIHHLI